MIVSNTKKTHLSKDIVSIFSRVLRDSTTRFVGPSVRPSVGPSVRPSVTLYFFWFFAVFGLTAPAQMMEWP